MYPLYSFDTHTDCSGYLKHELNTLSISGTLLLMNSTKSIGALSNIIYSMIMTSFDAEKTFYGHNTYNDKK